MKEGMARVKMGFTTCASDWEHDGLYPREEWPRGQKSAGLQDRILPGGHKNA